mgnify:CR=1 FL=1
MADDKNVVDFESYMKKIRALEEELNKQKEAAEQRAKQSTGQEHGEALKKLMEAYQAFLPSKEELSGMMGQLADAFQQAADQARAAQEAVKEDPKEDEGEE